MVSKIGVSSQRVSLNSLFVKCTVMVMVCVVAVVGTITVNEARTKKQLTEASLADRGSQVTWLVSMQLGGALRFGNIEAIEAVMVDVLESAQADAVGAYVKSAADEVLFDTLEDVKQVSQAETLAARAIETAAPVSSENGLMNAYPSFYGDGQDVVGAVVTSWSAESALAKLQAVQKQNLLLGGVVMLFGLMLSGLFLLSQMSRPLLQIEAAMRRVADGDYAVNVPFTRRGDELGKMARRLDTFRVALGDAKDAARESAFKSAAFGGSTAPMMMVDEQLEVIFLNPKCQELLDQLAGHLHEVWPSLDAAAPLGARLTDCAPVASTAQRILEQGEKVFPLSETVKIGDSLIKISMNAAMDEKGEMIGAVIQWSDRTEGARNSAVLQAIDDKQVRMEFAPDGSFLEANDAAMRFIGSESPVRDCLTMETVFAMRVGTEESTQDLLAAILAGKPISGQFECEADADGKKRIADGIFATVSGPQGTVERVIFLGSDVTESASAIRSASAEQKRIAEEQRNVVDALGQVLKDLSDGKLTTEIQQAFPPDYEKLKLDFNAAVFALRDTVATVVQNSDSIRNETKEITVAADDLSRRTEKQAATLEETAAALDELTSSVKSASEGADEASRISVDAQKNAQKGGEVAKRAIQAMDEIKTSSQEISKITSVIDEIAFQTNLLALNAGVEAARAGEAGRGFAVVATEVRALAQRSSDAAREINTLISSSSEQVQQGVELVDQTGAALSSIVSSVSEISQRISSIATSAHEQSVGLNEINSAVNDLDHVTQQNAAMFEETNAASHSLTAEADALASAVARFDLGERPVVSETGAPAPSLPEQPKSAVPRFAGNLAVADRADVNIDTGWEEF